MARTRVGGTEQTVEAEARAFLARADLLDRILADFAACGLVGEADNALLGYLAAASRKLPHPLAVILQASAAAGKSALLDVILGFVPEEDRLVPSTLSARTLFYLEEGQLRHKLLAITDGTPLREGQAERVKRRRNASCREPPGSSQPV